PVWASRMDGFARCRAMPSDASPRNRLRLLCIIPSSRDRQDTTSVARIGVSTNKHLQRMLLMIDEREPVWQTDLFLRRFWRLWRAQPLGPFALHGAESHAALRNASGRGARCAANFFLELNTRH